jgi:hypothetical protein
MLRMFVVAVLLASALQSHGQAPQPPQPNNAAANPQQPLVPATPASTPASTPANMPAQPAQVTYQDGLLAIHAENSTLADVLTQIQSKTGAQIQVPPGASTERVVIQEGPAPTRAVLDSLLHGSGFDYIIVGSTQDPQSIQRVVLTPHVATASTTAPPPAYSARRSQPAPDIQNDDDNTSEQPTMPVPPGPPRPGVQPPQPGQPGQQSQPGQETNPSSGGIKSPEQLLQELQQIQRGQQQPQGQTGQQTPGQTGQTPPQMPPRRVPMNPPHD